MKIDIQRLIGNKNYCENIFKHFISINVINKIEPELFGRHLNKALHNLEFANFILQEHEHSIKEKLKGKSFYDWCVTIFYYSIYHASLALISRLGYESKNHLATITTLILFYYHKDNILEKKEIEFIIEKMHLEKEDIDTIIDSKKLREEACYGADKSFELLQAKNMQKQTAEFINKVRGVLEE
ncbi:MAG: HEPN domain-containing protein [Nanoarchaeota archaeon]|nr:HEPN domain-containing protein [Nanoarchaeota archaeon]MBU1322357.1 HEPN domain-containing protein [Nanoarchaeota archaeon]MBU1596970.1 HEPN domain-containing protein [Nanoarchaeota archaeon]MBU2441695.1 HEPN domain-containing protein [Nanoarchaeota archaeon]